VTVVVDASVMVAALLDGGQDGEWSEEAIRGQRLWAPHLMPAEVTNIVRRSVAAKLISADAAAMALADLDALPMNLVPFRPFAGRVWELRDDLTSYDAWYVALAESLDAPMVSLDRRVARAKGPKCAVLVPK
jgi:predicted nucleic acid-binding protein